MATVISRQQSNHLKFASKGKFLGIPNQLVEQALGEPTHDRRIWFTLSVKKNRGVVLIIRPSVTPNARAFRGWKGNQNARRYYISSVSLLRALKMHKPQLLGRTFPTTIDDGTILAVLTR